MSDASEDEPLPAPETDPPPRAAMPEARATRSRWFGLVWAVPLAALLIVAFLGIRALSDRGVDVVVTFDTGAGARVDDTKVIYQGVEAGRVTKIEINADGRRVDMTLRLDPRADLGLTTTTKFWLVGANLSLNDISSVKAALAGLTIGVAPGIGGTPARHFIGLNEPPIIMPGTPGAAYTLVTSTLGTVSPGSPIFFRGQQVGRVTGVRFTAPDAFHLDVFILAPYDKLMRPAATFWISSPVQVSLTDNGASATLEHAGSLLNGAIELDFLNRATVDSPSAAVTEFPLYQSRKEAETGPPGPEATYAFRFTGPAGELSEGAAVRLLGFQVGVVKSVRLEVDPASGFASTAVVAVLYPQKLHVALPAGSTDANGWQRATDALVARLLAHGHRARLVQTPPVIGGRVISLDVVRGAGPATLGAGQSRVIPSDDASGGLDEMTGQVNDLLAKLNRFPLEAIGQDVRQITAKLNGIVSSPQLTDSLQHLNSTLAQADSMMHDVTPQVGPLVAKLNRAADEVTGTAAAAHDLLGGQGGAAAADGSLPAAIQELSDAARSIRALADYLGRHPESLIRGRGADKPDQTGKDGR
jgi:paraquat-inducible protein B